MRALLDPDNETKATCVIGKDEVIQGRINSVAKFRRCVRGAILDQIRIFFEHCSKGGGVKPMFKKYVANFV